MANASENRNRAVQMMTSRVGKNSYTQGGNRIYFFGKPDNEPGNTVQKGYSDCSSAVRAAIRAVTGVDIGSNTSAQINNRNSKGMVVHETEGYYPDESRLLPGDCLYFKGNTSHPLDVGHVEMYIGNGKICGHGSGTGPKIRNMRDYCASRATGARRYFMAVRWIGGEEETVRILAYGSYGEDVKILQQNLIGLGYDLGIHGADGDFGRDTQAAVKSFQTNNGLAADGIVGGATQAKILELLNGKGDPGENAPVEVPDEIEDGDGVIIAGGNWNVRTGPGAAYPSAGVVHGGDVLQRVDPGEWIPVLYNGEVRFISPKAVRE